MSSHGLGRRGREQKRSWPQDVASRETWRQSFAQRRTCQSQPDLSARKSVGLGYPRTSLRYPEAAGLEFLNDIWIRVQGSYHQYRYSHEAATLGVDIARNGPVSVMLKWESDHQVPLALTCLPNRDSDLSDLIRATKSEQIVLDRWICSNSPPQSSALT